MQQQAAAPSVGRPAPVELVPVQLTLGSSRDWVLWPVAAADEDLNDFADGLVHDLSGPPQFRRLVADTVRQQVADWVAHVPPPVTAAAPRRELVRLDLILGGALRLRDQFWWDLHAPEPAPEEFAAELCKDLGIEAAHGAAVAAAIRIELGKLRRAAPSSLQLPTPRIMEGIAGGDGDAAQLASAVGDAPQSIYSSSCLREPEEWHEWGPAVHVLTADERQALEQQQLAIQQRQEQQLAARLAARKQAAHAELERAQRQAQVDQQQAAQQQLQQQQQQSAQQQQSHGRQQQSQGQQQQQQQQQQWVQPKEEQLPPAAATAATAVTMRAAQPRKRDAQDAAPARRQLRPRRASNRLAELLRKEEESGGGGGSGSESEGGGSKGGGSKGGGSGGAPVGSKVSDEYQPGEDELLQNDAQEEAEAPRRTRQRRRSSGAAADVAHAKHAPAAAPAKQQQQQLGLLPSRHAQQQTAQQAQQQHAQQQTAQQAQQQHVQQQQALPMLQQQQMAMAAQAPLLPTPQQQSMLSGGSGSAGMVPLMGRGPSPNGLPGALLGGPGSGMVPVQPPPAGMMPTPGGSGMGLTAGMGPSAGGQGMGAPPPGFGGGGGRSPPPQHVQMVGAAIVHYARELNIGEHKIRSFLERAPGEQLALFRTLHQLVQQARARTAEGMGPPPGAGAAAGMTGQGGPAGMMGPAGPGMGLGGGLPPPMPGLAPPPMPAPAGLPPMPMPMPPGLPPMPAPAGLPPMPAPAGLPPMPPPAMGGLGGPALHPSMGGLPPLSQQEQLGAPASQFANLFSEMFD